MIRALLVAACVLGLSCSLNDYCLDCAREDAGGDADDGGGSGSGTDAAIDAGCIVTGPEECDGKDNDCNGLIDDGPMPQVGTDCSNQLGQCAGGTIQCTNGELKCNKAPSPEICDHLDNNCNGEIDEGNPGGGAKCGTDVGECVAGITSCNRTTGVIECFGFQDHTADPELCNGRDDDCDGNFDENLGSLGSCGPMTSDGECNIGTLVCQGGAPVCTNAVFPMFETCNAKDDDCDTRVDEVFDLQTDAKNCGSCGTVCAAHANANTRCTSGTCGFVCKAGYHDLNANADGCEYGPCFATGNEECDGVDNDCDGNTDEGLSPPAICASGGECSTTTATCSGSGGWVCNYAATVQFPETACDTKDNDCDGRVDEGQPNLGQACDDGRLGACKGTGTYACDSTNPDGAAVCEITAPGQSMPAATESCNGKDDDCDDNVDEAATDNFVDIKDAANNVLFRIYTYEASRPDATAMSVGTMAQRSCSRAGVLPWASVTEAQAAAACAAVIPGKSHLCTAAEWQRACEGLAGRRYPYGNSYQPNACNGNDYDPDCTLPDDDRALPTGSPTGCPTKPAQSTCITQEGALDMSGNLKEWTSTQVAPGAYGIRGGGYDTVAGGLTCQFDFVSASPTFTFANLGFRCCADP